MKKIRLGDLVNTSSGATPLSSNKEYYENGDIPWINSGEVGQYKINFAEKFITKEGFEKSNTKIFPKDTILVAMYGATAGKTSILNINACTNQAVCAILPSENVNNIFLKYKLDSIYDYLVQISSGSARDNLSQKVIQDLEINLPLLETQQKIAKILSDIDDKIEVLHQINDNLAELAKTIYDYWFVQFDFPDENGKPYKTSGGKMVYNEVLKREIPEGWEVKKLGEILKKNETTIKINAKDYLSSGSIPIIDQSSDFICGYTNEISALIKASNIPAIIFGDHTRILKFIDFDFARGADGTQILFSNNEKMPQYLFYHSLLKIDLSNYGYARHFKFLKEQKILLSDRLIAEKFTDNVKTIYEKIKINRNQIQHLQSLRDWLLPMLMNGQISVE